MKKFIVVFLLCFFISCKTEKSISNISCDGKVSVQYDRIKPEDRNKPKANKNINGCTVYFINEYDNQIEAYVDGKLKFEKYLKISDSSDSLENYFAFGYAENTEIPILKIKSKSQNTCFDIQIEKKYKLIYVFLSRNGKWTVRFSNIIYLI
ncbi:hypothetical protein [uncultured Flavobacterium sp.]|uniref:hypothetical protein n=1 Tax=uncultured Flavobacterium sp. TaxID=165435 RepID=UPI0030ECDB88|tara:strand:- start:9617 stop:10069 length:453 start_codon:yes stop_codon:yes gene_type:complete